MKQWCHLGIKAESAYYESLHEAPLIANTIARKKLYEMNRVISDTAEYGCYLFDHVCQPLLADFVDEYFNASGVPNHAGKMLIVNWLKLTLLLVLIQSKK